MDVQVSGRILERAFEIVIDHGSPPMHSLAKHAKGLEKGEECPDEQACPELLGGQSADWGWTTNYGHRARSGTTVEAMLFL